MTKAEKRLALSLLAIVFLALSSIASSLRSQKASISSLEERVERLKDTVWLVNEIERTKIMKLDTTNIKAPKFKLPMSHSAKRDSILDKLYGRSWRKKAQEF